MATLLDKVVPSAQSVQSEPAKELDWCAKHSKLCMVIIIVLVVIVICYMTIGSPFAFIFGTNESDDESDDDDEEQELKKLINTINNS